MELPSVIKGGTHVDARGVLRFCNDFDMTGIKRFYTITNSAEQPFRGWIGHKKETKWFFPVKGKTEVVVEPMADFNAEKRNRPLRVGATHGEATEPNEASAENGGEAERFVLKAEEPKVLKVPPGNWFFIEQHDGAEVMVFSDCKIGECENDDLRRPFI